MKKKLIIGNWKMNPTTLDEARRIFRSTKNTAKKLTSTEVVVCPPPVYIQALLTKRGDPVVSIGAQDAYFEEQGSFTGEVSPIMLRDLGVTHVIIGHSERREKGESDEVISEKVALALEAGLKVVLCVGEKERDEQGAHLESLKLQIKNSLNKVPKRLIGKLIVAYEPIWAVGAKEAMDPATVYEMSLFVKKSLADAYGHTEAVATQVLYGGSVNFRNAGDIIVRGKVDGLLVGRESVNSDGFTELLKAVDALK
ncbi:MAG: triosephosphate isomerase [Patescibacteria group bacterium]|nr:triosephosphate isomerase [Patescibacteria group bacterium]